VNHLAFNEPEDVDVDEFATRPTRVLAIAPESRAHMAINLSCALDLIPRRAVTVGMTEILAARRLSIHANRPWQCGIVRQALHGPVTPLCPASYLRRHPDARLTVADFVAEPREVCLR
jgi:glucosamine-6-phosphate deaminase